MAKPTLLIVDESEAFLASIQRALREEYEVHCARSGEEVTKALALSPDVLLLDLGFEKGYPEAGVKFAEGLRLYYRLTAPIILMALDNLDYLVRSFPFLRQDTPGTYLIKAPFELGELRGMITKAEPVKQGQLRMLGLERCSFKEHCGRLIHDLRNAVRGDRERALIILRQMKGAVEFFTPEPDLLGKMDELITSIADLGEGSDYQRIEQILSLISERLGVLRIVSAPIDAEIVEKWRGENAAVGFTHVLIVDDDVYPPIRELELKGYSCDQVFSYDEAYKRLEVDPPDVLLCDYRLGGERGLGEALMKKALSKGIFVIMLSAGPIDISLPSGVAKCEGSDKFNVDLIHALICERTKHHNA